MRVVLLDRLPSPLSSPRDDAASPLETPQRPHPEGHHLGRAGLLSVLATHPVRVPGNVPEAEDAGFRSLRGAPYSVDVHGLRKFLRESRSSTTWVRRNSGRTSVPCSDTARRSAETGRAVSEYPRPVDRSMSAWKEPLFEQQESMQIKTSISLLGHRGTNNLLLLINNWG